MYASLIAAALDGVAETITVEQNANSSYNANTGEYDTVLTNSVSGDAVFTSFSDDSIDGSMVQSGDLRCELIADGLTWTPQPGDHVVRGGSDRLAIVRVEARNIASEVVSYFLQVRGDSP